MSVKERLIEYLKLKKIGYSQFGRTIDVSSAFVTSMRNSIQPDKVERIALNYPDLNIGWLLTGEGKMLRTDALGLLPENLGREVGEEEVVYENKYSSNYEAIKNTIEAKYVAKIEKLEAKIDQKDEQIDMLIRSVDRLTEKESMDIEKDSKINVKEVKGNQRESVKGV